MDLALVSAGACIINYLRAWTENSFLNIDLIGPFSKCDLICLLIFIVIRLRNYCKNIWTLWYICGYECDKAVKWYIISLNENNDIISLHGFELSSQIDCNNLVDSVKNCFGGKNCFAVLSTLSCTSTWWLAFFKHVITKLLLHVKSPI